MPLSSPLHTSLDKRWLRSLDVRPLAIEFPSWPVTALAVPIVVRAAIFAVVLTVEPWSASPTRVIPAWAQILQATCFAALAFMLLRYGRSDRRAWSLGLFVMDAAATLLTPFVRAIDVPSAAVWAGLHMRTDAFQAALVWFFASLFPRSSLRPRLARLFYLGTALAFLLGVALVVLDTIAQVLPAAPSLWRQFALALQRESAGNGDWYFTLQFAWLTPLLWLMPRKLSESGPDDRRRFTWLALGIVVGFLPLVLNVVMNTLWPTDAVDEPSARRWGIVIVAALTAVPIAGAHAALVQRTLDVRLVMRRAFQHVLARSVVRALVAAPVAGLIVLVAANRDQSAMALITGPSSVLLAALAAAAVGATVGRRQVMTMLDRRFFREQAEARNTLIGAVDAVRQADSMDRLRGALTQAAEQAFHPETLVTVIVGADRNLHAIDADLLPLGGASALAQLVGATDAPLQLSSLNAALMDRLASRDHAWLQAARAVILVPLRGAAGQLLGLLALGEKASELPYSPEDGTLLASAGSAAGVVLDRILTEGRNATRPGVAALMDPPARECVECGTVFRADAVSCPCGGRLQRAAAPHTLEDRLRFERRVGAGAMGVVYRVLDLRLSHVRAVKTLSGADPAMMARLRREARSMASAQHPNLATLHGVEIWRGAPMLVMEFLDGGTLSERLRRGPVPAPEAMRLGVRLASGLDAIHRIRLLHRDVKPSNIGFTEAGVPKLLDFGLAKVVEPAAQSTGAATHDSTGSAVFSSGVGIHGTPAYLSPEVLAGEQPTPRDDLWSLAVTLLEACTGSNPFHAPTIVATVARVSSDGRRVGEATSSLEPQMQRLFADLLGPLTRRPSTARQLTDRLTQLT